MMHFITYTLSYRPTLPKCQRNTTLASAYSTLISYRRTINALINLRGRRILLAWPGHCPVPYICLRVQTFKGVFLDHTMYGPVQSFKHADKCLIEGSRSLLSERSLGTYKIHFPMDYFTDVYHSLCFL